LFTFSTITQWENPTFLKLLLILLTQLNREKWLSKKMAICMGLVWGIWDVGDQILVIQKLYKLSLDSIDLSGVCNFGDAKT
jgi:hypothetical protein